jgi:hypothetical protein
VGARRPRGMGCGFVSQNPSPLGAHTRKTNIAMRGKPIGPLYKKPIRRCGGSCQESKSKAADRSVRSAQINPPGAPPIHALRDCGEYGAVSQRAFARTTLLFQELRCRA